MENNERMTAPIAPVAADVGQSLNPLTGNSIPETVEDIKNFNERASQEEILLEMRNASNPSYLKTLSMADLFDKTFIRNPPIIDGLLYPGAYIFAGAPKLGKSFLMTQIAYHVSTGTPLWGIPVRQGTVLYMALEDEYSRLQDRLYRMFGVKEEKNLRLAVAAHSINQGLFEQLNYFMSEYRDTSLIIIDTLQKVREVCGDTYSYAKDYQTISWLKGFADHYGICLMLVHHTRKQPSDDSFDMVSGTNGLTGCADGTFLLNKKKRTDKTAVLEITGRDMPDQKLHLIRNEDTLCWDLVRRETDLWKAPPEPILEQIAQFITPEHPEWAGSPTELQALLGVDIQPNALSQKLNVNATRLFEEHKIRYWNKRTHAGRKIALRLEVPA